MAGTKILDSVPTSVVLMHAKPPESPWWDERTADRLVSDPKMEAVWRAISNWAQGVRDSKGRHTGPTLDRILDVGNLSGPEAFDRLTKAQFEELAAAASGELEERTYLFACILAKQWMSVPKMPFSEAKSIVEQMGIASSRLGAKIQENDEAIAVLDGSATLVDLIEAAFRERNEDGVLSHAQEQALATVRNLSSDADSARLPDLPELLAVLSQTLDRGIAPGFIAPRPTKPNAEDACRTYICQVLCRHFQFDVSLENTPTPLIPLEEFATLVNVIYNDKYQTLTAGHLKKIIAPQLATPVSLFDLGA